MSPVLYPPRDRRLLAKCWIRVPDFQATLLKCLPYSVLATVAGPTQNIYVIITGRTCTHLATATQAGGRVYLLGAIMGARSSTRSSFDRRRWRPARRPRARRCYGKDWRNVPANILMVIVIAVVVGICFIPLAAVPAAYRSGALRSFACRLSTWSFCFCVRGRVAGRAQGPIEAFATARI